MKKKGHIITLLMGILVGLSACGAEKSSGLIITGKDSGCEQSVFFNTNGNLATGPDGYYTLNFPGNDMYLTYIDKGSAKETYLCGKPECSHVDEKGYFVLETCNSYVGRAVLYSEVYHNGYVYVLIQDEQTFDVTLMRISADGSVHENIMVVGQASTQGSLYSYVFIDDNTIMMIYNPPDYTGEERTVSLECIDLEKKEKASVYEYTDPDASISCLKVFDNHIFFIRFKRQDDYFIYQLMSYDRESGETVALFDESVYSYTIAGDGLLFYSVAADGLYCCDLETMNTELVRKADEETMYVTLAYDGTFLYLDNFTNRFYYNEESEHSIFVCDLTGKVINTISGGVLFTELSDADYMFTYSFSEERPYWAYIRKEDITKPNISWSAVEK